MDKKMIKQVAWVGENLVSGKIKGIVLSFHGLGRTGLKSDNDKSLEDLEWSREGALMVFPYYGPWSWMNRQAREFVDELVSSIIREYKLPKNIPIISTGGSMGGMSALLYTRYSRHKITACYANCPVCDFRFHFTERPDLPPTIYNAFRGYPEDIDTLFREHSPLEQVDGMPDIPYLIIHGGKDLSVNKKAHSDKMAAKMKKRGLNVQYIEVPYMTHCGPVYKEELVKILSFVKKFLK